MILKKCIFFIISCKSDIPKLKNFSHFYSYLSITIKKILDIDLSIRISFRQKKSIFYIYDKILTQLFYLYLKNYVFIYYYFFFWKTWFQKKMRLKFHIKIILYYRINKWEIDWIYSSCLICYLITIKNTSLFFFFFNFLIRDKCKVIWQNYLSFSHFFFNINISE